MSSLHHALAGVFLGAALAGSALAAPSTPGQVCYFGEGGPSAAGRAAPAAATNRLTKLAEHGSWALYKDQDGTFIVMDSFTDGATLGLIVKSDVVGMVLADPTWDLPAGQVYPIRIVVDGKVYSGTAKVSPDGSMMLVRGLTRDFLQAFYRGDEAVITVADSRWTLHLPEAARVIDAAVARR